MLNKDMIRWRLYVLHPKTNEWVDCTHEIVNYHGDGYPTFEDLLGAALEWTAPPGSKQSVRLELVQ